MANDKAVSEPVCLADGRGKSASRSQSIILLRTHLQKVTSLWFPCVSMSLKSSFHGVLLLSYRVVRPDLAKPSL